jgi:hypothetical protein
LGIEPSKVRISYAKFDVRAVRSAKSSSFVTMMASTAKRMIPDHEISAPASLRDGDRSKIRQRINVDFAFLTK